MSLWLLNRFYSKQVNGIYDAQIEKLTHGSYSFNSLNESIAMIMNSMNSINQIGFAEQVGPLLDDDVLQE